MIAKEKHPMKIKTISSSQLSGLLKQQVYNFLNRHIPEGTVAMPPEIYESAHFISLLFNNENRIVGFSAQKVFNEDYCTIIQIMATFLDKSVRGAKYASLLLQGKPFLISWKKNLTKSIYWCTRTRIPAAYAAASKYNSIYPKISNINENLNFYKFADCVAKTVYGDNISLTREHYVLKNSYNGADSFMALPGNKKTNRTTGFMKENIDYEKNEAIFIISKMDLTSLFKYWLLVSSYKIKGRIAGFLKLFRIRNINWAAIFFNVKNYR